MAEKKYVTKPLPEFDKDVADMKKDKRNAQLRLALYIVILIAIFAYVFIQAFG